MVGSRQSSTTLPHAAGVRTDKEKGWVEGRTREVDGVASSKDADKEDGPDTRRKTGTGAQWEGRRMKKVCVRSAC